MAQLTERDLVVLHPPNAAPQMFVFVLVDQEDKKRESVRLDRSRTVMHIFMAYKRGLDRGRKSTAASRNKRQPRWRPELLVGPFPCEETATLFSEIALRGLRNNADALIESCETLALELGLAHANYRKK